MHMLLFAITCMSSKKMRKALNESNNMELIAQEHIKMPEFCSQEYSAESEWMEDTRTYLEDKEYIWEMVNDMVKESLAENSQKIIDLAISTYIINRKNKKLERRSFELVSTKKSVSK